MDSFAPEQTLKLAPQVFPPPLGGQAPEFTELMTF